MNFLDYCQAHRILLAVFPSHSTLTLQLLDVVCFKPLSNYYTKELTRQLHRTQGLIPVKKGDFFPLFWRAWVSSFTTGTVLKSFEATGIWPMNYEAIPKRFKLGHPQEQDGETAPSVLEPSNWCQMDRLVRSAVRKTAADVTKQPTRTSLLHLYHDSTRMIRPGGNPEPSHLEPCRS
jgi:hypothetical protein